jgi:hypothetical protein
MFSNYKVVFVFKRYQKILKNFEKLKIDTHRHCLTGDNRTINIEFELSKT